MSGLFLTHEELRDLTGYCHAKHQRQWLSKEGIPFHANRMGHPKVNRSFFVQNGRHEQEQEDAPDFGAI